jgi:hypothetical protein
LEICLAQKGGFVTIAIVKGQRRNADEPNQRRKDDEDDEDAEDSMQVLQAYGVY